MKGIKKAIAIASACALVGAACAGCGGGAPEGFTRI